jgi:hypothetical protein
MAAHGLTLGGSTFNPAAKTMRGHVPFFPEKKKGTNRVLSHVVGLSEEPSDGSSHDCLSIHH